MALKRIKAELAELRRDPPPGCTAAPNGTDYFQWTGSIEGPPGTPYEGGLFNVRITFPQSYPLKPFTVTLTTRIFHPNISELGAICDHKWCNKWSASVTVKEVLWSVWQLMIQPDEANPVDTNIGSLYTKNRKNFNETARHWTLQHAYPPAGYVFTTTQTTTSPANNQDSAGTGGSGSESEASDTTKG
ncbi:unnamed protein product [Medioppia subpectinata]|uniref:UBC core domain-containing protein n=1 Tax=Medioppia subpectinata TaxID=1979941 RepID=A0A7R9KHZ0_9ACAR|nr:unnamed protein product [Medioppia subpectinata]CAG2104024.1 unnamed protein product [Medioppia subpectinata]